MILVSATISFNTIHVPFHRAADMLVFSQHRESRQVVLHVWQLHLACGASTPTLLQVCPVLSAKCDDALHWLFIDVCTAELHIEDENAGLCGVCVFFSVVRLENCGNFDCPSARDGGPFPPIVPDKGRQHLGLCQSIHHPRFGILLKLPRPIARNLLGSIASVSSRPHLVTAGNEYRPIGVGHHSLSLKSFLKDPTKLRPLWSLLYPLRSTTYVLYFHLARSQLSRSSVHRASPFQETRST
jgi:hypothetical protein